MTNKIKSNIYYLLINLNPNLNIINLHPFMMETWKQLINEFYSDKKVIYLEGSIDNPSNK